MSRNEAQTRTDLIDPVLTDAGWSWDAEVLIGPGRVNLSGDRMYDQHQAIIADYVLKLYGMPLAILEAKAEGKPATDAIQQGERYARRLDLRFSIASNGHQHILSDLKTGETEILDSLPTPGDILHYYGLNSIPQEWQPAFEHPWYVDQITKRKVRPYQERAIFEAMYQFSQERRRVLLLMATGTGKTFTVVQLAYKLLSTDVLPHQRLLFLTDRNSLKGQAYRAFSAFEDERVIIDKKTVDEGRAHVGKVFFANYQNLDEELNGKKLYEHFDPDFFDVIVVDECHRSGFGDWFGVLEHFGSAFQLGLTATPRELAKVDELEDIERRRHTYDYFGDPIYTYSLKQAIEDGYLVPYLLEQRVSNVDDEGYTGPDGKRYHTPNFERDIVIPARTKWIAEDLYAQLQKYDLVNEKTIIFCVNDTHAAFMASELRRVAGDPDFAARITRAERNSEQLERNFQEIGRAKPRVAVSVDLLTTGFDAPDVKNIVFARPLKSAILYKQMKGRGTRLCEDVDKRYFTIWDYSGASSLEDAEFDGHPANTQSGKLPTKKPGKKKGDGPDGPKVIPVVQGVTVELAGRQRFVCLADGRKIPFDEYTQQSRETLRTLVTPDLKALLDVWVNKDHRQELRNELREADIYITAFQHYWDMLDTDEVDVLSKVGFDLPRVPNRHDRVARFWDKDIEWLLQRVHEADVPPETDRPRTRFWETCTSHYELFGIDDLEDARTFSTPQFVEQFGSFRQLLSPYGSPTQLRADLEDVKKHLYIPMVA